MVVRTTGHKIHCILLQKVAIFNKGIAFYGIKIFAVIMYIVKNTYNHVYLLCCKYAKQFAVKDVPMNNAASKHTSMLISSGLQEALHPICSGKLQVLKSSPKIHNGFRIQPSHPIEDWQ